MKKLSVLSAVFILALCFAGAAPASAQTKEREFITAQVIIKKERFDKEIKVPVSENPFSENGVFLRNGEFFAGGWATVHCFKCPLTGEYRIVVIALPQNKDTSKMNISVSFMNKRKCDVEDKEILVKRDEKAEVNLRCGVKIVAYY